MTAPLPPSRTSSRTATACAVLAGLVVAVVLVVVLPAVVSWMTAAWLWLTSPILPPPESRPIPASTAAPAPIAPAELTEIPIHQRGPQALRSTPDLETAR